MASSAQQDNHLLVNIKMQFAKLESQDSDLRFMALNDIYTSLSKGSRMILTNERDVCGSLVEGLIKTVDDSNGDVQNMSVKCMKPFVLKAEADSVNAILKRLIHLNTSKAVDSSVAASALTAVISAYPPARRGSTPQIQTSEGFRAVKKEVLPRFIGSEAPSSRQGKGSKAESPKGQVSKSDAPTLEVLIEIIRVFGGLMEQREVSGLLQFLTAVTEDSSAPSISKKLAIQAIAQLAAHLDDVLLSDFVTSIIHRFTNSHSNIEARRNRIYLISSVTKMIPTKFGVQLKTLVPFVISPVSAAEADDESAEDDDRAQVVDLRDTALLALETFFSVCPDHMSEFAHDSCAAARRYIGYDPNMMSDDEEGSSTEDEGEKMDEEDDDYFAEAEDDEAGFGDSDDESWRLRRASAKLFAAMALSTAPGSILTDANMFRDVLRSLIHRLKEHEENVRLEVINSLRSLIRQAGTSSGVFPLNDAGPRLETQSAHSANRKRRRADSDLSASQHSSLRSRNAAGLTHQNILEELKSSCSQIIGSSIRIINVAPPSSKQAVIELINTLTVVISSQMSEAVKQFLPLIAEVASSSSVSQPTKHVGGTSTSMASTGTVQRAALQCMASTFTFCSAPAIIPMLPVVIPVLLAAMEDRFQNTSEEAITTGEQLIECISTLGHGQRSPTVSNALHELRGQLSGRMNATGADAIVRGRAIRALGTLLAHGLKTDSVSPIGTQERDAALSSFGAHLKSELLRPYVLSALSRMTRSMDPLSQLPAKWVQTTAVELASYLRKSDASVVRQNIITLRDVVVASRQNISIDQGMGQGLCAAVLPLISSTDMVAAQSCLEILTVLLQRNSIDASNLELQRALARLAATSISGQQLDLLASLYAAMGPTSGAKPLMQSTLAIGTAGEPLVIGRLVGTLLMSSSGLGYRLEDFVQEIDGAQDDLRRCLALAVVGTVGQLQNSSSKIQPSLFIRFFESPSDKVALIAAISFGRAASTHLGEYMALMEKPASKRPNQHQFLYSIKEIISISDVNFGVFGDQFWDYILAASQDDKNRAVASECLGRLAASDPARFLSRIGELLKYTDAGKRGTGIAAIRFVLSDLDEGYDEHLRPILGPSICQMLEDSELTNVRAALLTLHSALRHTPQILESSMPHLMPLVLRQAVIYKELIRSVSVGPFTIKVDDGLDTRRTAYEALYAILASPDLVDPSILLQIVPRIADGFGDDRDIQAQSTLMLQKALTIDPNCIKPHTSSFEKAFTTVLNTKLKDSAVRAEIEHLESSCRLVASTSKTINAIVKNTGDSQWDTYMSWLRRDKGNYYSAA